MFVNGLSDDRWMNRLVECASLKTETALTIGCCASDSSRECCFCSSDHGVDGLALLQALFLLFRFSAMNSLEMENEIRVLLGSGEIGALEGLLVDSADWGVNIRMTLNENFVEVDLIKNWDGFEMILLDDQDRNSVQIDELKDILQVLKSHY